MPRSSGQVTGENQRDRRGKGLSSGTWPHPAASCGATAAPHDAQTGWPSTITSAPRASKGPASWRCPLVVIHNIQYRIGPSWTTAPPTTVSTECSDRSAESGTVK